MNKITKIIFLNIRIKLLKMIFVEKLSFPKAILVHDQMNPWIPYNIQYNQYKTDRNKVHLDFFGLILK